MRRSASVPPTTVLTANHAPSSVWDVETRSCVGTLDHFGCAPAARPTQRRATELCLMPAHSLVHSLAWHPDGGALASGCSDGGVRLWDLRTATLAQTHGGGAGAGAARTVAFHPLGACVASGSADGTLRLLDLRRATLAYTLMGHSTGGAGTAQQPRRPAAAPLGVLSCAFSRRGDFLASGGSDAQLLVWRTNAEALVNGRDDAPRGPSPEHAPASPPPTSPALPVWRSARGWSPSPIPAALLARPHAPSPPEPTPTPEPDAGEAAQAYALRRGVVVRSVARAEPAAAENHGVAEALATVLAQMQLVQRTLGLLEARMTIQENQLARLQGAPLPVAGGAASLLGGVEPAVSRAALPAENASWNQWRHMADSDSGA